MFNDDFEAYRVALRTAVHEALDGHPEDAATVNEGVDADAGIWGIEITPAASGAATGHIAYGGGDEVAVRFGETHVYMWNDDPRSLADEVRDLLAAVFAGQFVEAGKRGDSFARVATPDGTTTHVGAMHLPLPWRMRRRRTYKPYSAR